MLSSINETITRPASRYFFERCGADKRYGLPRCARNHSALMCAHGIVRPLSTRKEAVWPLSSRFKRV
jgi:hypothetical protein